MASPQQLPASALHLKRGRHASAALLLLVLVASRQGGVAQLPPASWSNTTPAGLIASKLVSAFTGAAVGHDFAAEGGLPAPTTTLHNPARQGQDVTAGGGDGKLDLAQLMRNITLLKRALQQLGVALQKDVAAGESGNSSSPQLGAWEALDLPLEQWQALRQALAHLQVLPQQGGVSGAEGGGGAAAGGGGGVQGIAAEEEEATHAPGRRLQTNVPTAPVGSGDNLLAFRKRVQLVKQLYRDARNYLGPDDAVRLGGYLNTLEGLGILYISTYPVAELAYFTANLKLAADITGVVFRVLRLARGYIDLAARVINLEIAIEAARRVAAAQAAAAPAADSSRAADSPSGGSSAAAAGSGRARLRDALNGQVDSNQLLNDVLAASEELNSQVVPWVVGGGLDPPLRIAQAALRLTSSSLSRLQSWRPEVAGTDILDQVLRPAETVTGA